MKRHPRALFAVLLLLLLFTAVAVLAQTSSDFNLEWHVIAGGGGKSASSSYRLEGTIGQSIASPPFSGSGSFVVSSGYHYAASVIHLPIVSSD